jgi:uncharacterized membrane protein (DUF485 family)
METSRITGAAVWSSIVICIIYFALLCLSIWAKAFLGILIVPGLSVGIALTLLGIAISIGLTWLFVKNANSID